MFNLFAGISLRFLFYPAQERGRGEGRNPKEGEISFDSKLVKKMKNLSVLEWLRLNRGNNVSIKKKITLLDQIQASKYSFKHTI